LAFFPAAAATSRIARQLRRLRVGQDVVAVDGLVAAVQDIATPLAHEHAFGRAALITGAGVDRASAERRPANDLDATAAGVVDEMAVTLEGRRRRVHDRHLHVRDPRRHARVEIVDGR
jgi:hypothetical protein